MTARMRESVVRIAEAHARMRNSPVVENYDLKFAMELMALNVAQFVRIDKRKDLLGVCSPMYLKYLFHYSH